MSSNSSSNRGRSRSNSGGRRRSSGSSPRRDGARQEHRPSQPVKKQGFFSKILSAIGLGGGKNKPASGKPQRSARTDRPEGASSPRQARKPERIEVTTPRVYVGNLSFDATESDLLELFGGVGSVQNVEIVSNRETHRSKGFGFVQLTTVDEAKRAVDELHDKEYMGRKLVVSGAKAAPEQRSDRRSSETSGESDAAAAA